MARSAKQIAVKRSMRIMLLEASRISKLAGIAITDSTGALLAMAGMEDANPETLRYAHNKAYIAMRGASIEGNLEGRPRPMLYVLDEGFVSPGEALVVRREGKVLCAIGISGVNVSDELRIAELGARVLLMHWPNRTPQTVETPSELSLWKRFVASLSGPRTTQYPAFSLAMQQRAADAAGLNAAAAQIASSNVKKIAANAVVRPNVR